TLLPYLDGTIAKSDAISSSSAKTSPDAKDKAAGLESSALTLEAWETNDAKVFSWLIGSMETSIAMTLRNFDTAAEAWDHLRRSYSQVNASRIFEVEYALARLDQGDMDVRSFLLAAQTLWTEQDFLASSLLPSTVSIEIRQERERSRQEKHRNRVLQFLMKLRPEFETIRAHLIGTNNTDMDSVMGELVRAETRLQTQAKIDGVASDNCGSVFAATPGRNFNSSGRPPFTPHRPQIGQFTPSGHLTSSGQGDIKCRHCGEIGHMVSVCRKRNYCNYCKRSGHIITECRTKQRRASYNSAGSSTYNPSRGSQFSGQSNSYMISQDDSASRVSSAVSISPTDIQRMMQDTINQAIPNAMNAAFATLGVSGPEEKDADRGGH
ncbi:hypothetical protein LINPERPRIM_LOCUS24550, partial [Linum perenne]